MNDMKNNSIDMKKPTSKYERVSLKLNSDEALKIEKVMTKLEENKLNVSVNQFFKFLLKDVSPEVFCKDLQKKKQKREELRKKFEEEERKIWL
jgi:dihydroorotase